LARAATLATRLVEPRSSVLRGRENSQNLIAAALGPHTEDLPYSPSGLSSTRRSACGIDITADQSVSGLMRGIPSRHRLLNAIRLGAVVADSNFTFTWSDGPGWSRVTDQPAAGDADTIVAVTPTHRTVTVFPASVADRSTGSGGGGGVAVVA
jgi:hypothetical protein